MNEIVNSFLLAGDQYMPEMHLRRLGITYSTCGLFTKKNKESIQKSKETRDSRYLSERTRKSLFSKQHGLRRF